MLCHPFSHVSPRGLLVVLLATLPQSLLNGQTCTGSGNPCVLTGQYNNSRTSYNSNETQLTSSAVGTNGMQKDFILQVDNTSLPSQYSNPILAQPLYVAQMTNVQSGTHDLLIAVTLNGTVFAWDAENGACNGTSSLCWSRQGTTGTHGTNALYIDDCGTGATPVTNTATTYAGIVGTPVIDISLSTPAIFLTSYCQNSGTDHWYLHKLKLADGSDLSGSPVEIRAGSGASAFSPIGQMQRTALLEVDSIIYFGFGTAAQENTTSNPYRGWLFAYDTSLNQKVAWATTAYNSCGSGGGTSQCTTSDGTPSCDCKVPSSSYANAPNWGGHGAGVWMSGGGPAASGTLSDGYNHVFFAGSNGGFTEFQTGGSNNFGQSIIDFRVSSSTIETGPYQSFTSWSSLLSPSLSLSLCDGGVQCSYAYELQNEADWDMGVSGVLLFSDPASTPRVLTVDKAGYGYVLTQGNLCGTGVSGCNLEASTPVQGFASGDNGNVFPFGAVNGPGSYFCTYTADPDKCYRITSLAYYNDSDQLHHYLALWPFQEPLEVFQVSDNSQQTGGGTISASSSKSVTGSTCSSGSCPNTCAGGSCFLSQVIAGDSVIPYVSGTAQCTLGTNCPIVTSVTDDTHLTVSSALNLTGASWKYAGFFINPSFDSTSPTPGSGYAGGALTVASNGDSSGVIWAILASPTTPYYFNGTRTSGTLYAYNFSPSSHALTQLWNSGSLGVTGFCAAPFARPTVANGLVFTPTWALGNTCPPTSGSTSSGLVVYSLK